MAKTASRRTTPAPKRAVPTKPRASKKVAVLEQLLWQSFADLPAPLLKS